MRIEAARPEDEKAIYELTCELEAEALPRESFHEIYERIISSENDCILTAREEAGDKRVIGYVHVRLAEELHHGGAIANVQEMIVTRELRGRHIGSALLKRAVELAGERGALCVELTSHFSRKPAHRFYEAMGFEKTSYKFVLELCPAVCEVKTDGQTRGL